MSSSIVLTVVPQRPLYIDLLGGGEGEGIFGTGHMRACAYRRYGTGCEVRKKKGMERVVKDRFAMLGMPLITRLILAPCTEVSLLIISLREKSMCVF